MLILLALLVNVCFTTPLNRKSRLRRYHDAEITTDKNVNAKEIVERREILDLFGNVKEVVEKIEQLDSFGNVEKIIETDIAYDSRGKIQHVDQKEEIRGSSGHVKELITTNADFDSDGRVRVLDRVDEKCDPFSGTVEEVKETDIHFKDGEISEIFQREETILENQEKEVIETVENFDEYGNVRVMTQMEEKYDSLGNVEEVREKLETFTKYGKIMEARSTYFNGHHKKYLA